MRTILRIERNAVPLAYSSSPWKVSPVYNVYLYLRNMLSNNPISRTLWSLTYHVVVKGKVESWSQAGL